MDHDDDDDDDDNAKRRLSDISTDRCDRASETSKRLYDRPTYLSSQPTTTTSGC